MAEEQPALYGSVILDITTGTARWSPELPVSSSPVVYQPYLASADHATYTVLPLRPADEDYSSCKLILDVVFLLNVSLKWVDHIISEYFDFLINTLWDILE